jgi:MFS family permease
VVGEAGIGRRAVAGGLAIGIAVGWTIASLGAVATRLSTAYGVGLATIGLFTTVQFAAHMVMQIPGGRAADRWGARTSSFAGLALITLGNAVALLGPWVWLGFLGRGIVGLGTGFGFVGGADYVRARGGSPVAQGLYGASTLVSPGFALALVPGLATWVGFRAPYLSGVIVTAACALVLAAAPASAPTVQHAPERDRRPDLPAGRRRLGRRRSQPVERLDMSFVRDRSLYRLAIIHCFSFGFSVIAGNWVVTLLERHGQSKGIAAAVGSLTLLLGAVTRVAGGPLLRRPDARRWLAGSLVVGGAASVALALPITLAGWIVAATVLGLAAGVPYAKVFTGAAAARPDAPGASVGFVNGWSSLTIVAGTPLVGLTFSLPGDGRIGFAALGVLSALAAFATPR